MTNLVKNLELKLLCTTICTFRLDKGQLKKEIGKTRVKKYRINETGDTLALIEYLTPAGKLLKKNLYQEGFSYDEYIETLKLFGINPKNNDWISESFETRRYEKQKLSK